MAQRYERQVPLDEQGLPTTYVCFELLRYIFDQGQQYTSRRLLKSQFATRKKDIELLCDQLLAEDYLERHPANEELLRYNVNCGDYERQCNFENYLVDVERLSIPVRKLLRFSPSFV